MSNLIRREDVAEILTDPAYPYEPQIERAILRLPAVDAVEVKHGRWVKETNRGGHWHCSECGLVVGRAKDVYMYCYGCGAKMDGGKDDEAD